tara:strand:- start:746 stop:958 length:213 start_codon:yes stop_codon:yes gene_type:complete
MSHELEFDTQQEAIDAAESHDGLKTIFKRNGKHVLLIRDASVVTETPIAVDEENEQEVQDVDNEEEDSEE